MVEGLVFRVGRRRGGRVLFRKLADGGFGGEHQARDGAGVKKQAEIGTYNK